MGLTSVKSKDGLLYTESKNGGFVKRDYGEFRHCQNCEKEFFSKNNQYKIGWGRFCSVKCSSQMENNPRWNGGRRISYQGYVMVKMPSHSASDSNGYVREHRLIMEKQIKRQLNPSEVVHHINGLKQDNRPENLRLFSSNAEHRRCHRGLRRAV